MNSRFVSINIVKDDSYAAQIGLKPYDVIYKIDGDFVTTPQSVNEALQSGAASFEVIRGDELMAFYVSSKSLGVVLGEIEFDEETWLDKQKENSVILSTAQSIPGKSITKTIDIVGSQCVYGVNALADFTAGIRDFVGGRSRTLQSMLAEARKEVSAEIRAEAHKLGANGVIAIHFEHSEIGDKGGFMLLVAATGTAVVIE